MGYLASATTIYARAYLTGRGREYLFNNTNIRFDSLGNDLFRITSFTLGDPDVNYKTSEVLPEGWVPDVSGKYDSCLKTALDYEQRNLLFFQNFSQVIGNDVDYTTDANGNILNVNVNLNDNDIAVGVDGGTTQTNTNGTVNVVTVSGRDGGNVLSNNGNITFTEATVSRQGGSTNDTTSITRRT